jgi:hypothetical protein
VQVIFLLICGGGFVTAMLRGEVSWWPWFAFPAAAAICIVWLLVKRPPSEGRTPLG